MRTNYTRGLLLAVFGCVFWGASGIGGQYLLLNRGVSPFWLTGSRLVLSGVILLTLDRVLTGRNPYDFWRDKDLRLPMIAFGIIGMLGTQFLYFATIKESNAAVSTILQYLMALFIVLWVCLRERRLPTPREIFCTTVAIAGTVLIVTGGRWGARLVVGWGMLTGGLVCLPFAQPWNYDLPHDLSFLGAFAFVILVGTVLAFWFYIASVQYIPPQVTGILGAIEPLSSILFSMVCFGLSFGLVETAGIALILGAVFALGRA